VAGVAIMVSVRAVVTVVTVVAVVRAAVSFVGGVVVVTGLLRVRWGLRSRRGVMPDVIRVPLMLVIVPHPCTYSRGVCAHPSLPRTLRKPAILSAGFSPPVAKVPTSLAQPFVRSAKSSDAELMQ
jgi:hypothetical protein